MHRSDTVIRGRGGSRRAALAPQADSDQVSSCGPSYSTAHATTRQHKPENMGSIRTAQSANSPIDLPEIKSRAAEHDQASPRGNQTRLRLRCWNSPIGLVRSGYSKPDSRSPAQTRNPTIFAAHANTVFRRGGSSGPVSSSPTSYTAAKRGVFEAVSSLARPRSGTIKAFNMSLSGRIIRLINRSPGGLGSGLARDRDERIRVLSFPIT